MRLALALVLLAAVLAACGGDGGPSAGPTSESPAASPTAEPSPTAAVIACDGPLPEGEVAFQGRVRDVEGASGEGEYLVTKVNVILDRVEAQPGAAVYGVEAYVPHSLLPVVLLGEDWPEFAPGDCVLGAGSVHRYACGPACDAAGFVADALTRAPGTPRDETERRSATASGQAPVPDVWFLGEVKGERTEGDDPVFTWRVVSTGVLEIFAMTSVNARLDWGDREEADVLLPWDRSWPDLQTGDVVEVAGRIEMFACGSACDAVGFVPTYIRVLD